MALVRKENPISNVEPPHWIQVDKAYIEKCQVMLDSINTITDPDERARKIALLKGYLGHVIDINMVGIEEQNNGAKAKDDVLITLGGTINIDNFENIKFEVQGFHLEKMFEKILVIGDSVGRSHVPTRDRVESYFSRVFDEALPHEPATPTVPREVPAAE